MRKLYNALKEKIKGNVSVFIMLHLLLLLLFAYLYNNIVYSIYSGQGGVLYLRFFGGTVVDRVYGEGVHFIFPWDKMYIYNTRVQQVAHEFHVLTKNGLKIHLFISIRYYPEYKLLGVLHQKVGPTYVEKVVIPEIESVLRVLIGRLTAEEVYTTEQAIYEKALTQAIEQVAQRFVNVDNVIIKRIVLPKAIEEAIQDKIEQKHIAEAFVFRLEREEQEAKRKRIEAAGLKDYNQILSVSLSDEILQWKGIQATLELALSNNSKVVVVGSGKRGLPILGNLIMDEPGVGGFAGPSQRLGAAAHVEGSDETKSDTSVTPTTTTQNISQTGVGSDLRLGQTSVPDANEQQPVQANSAAGTPGHLETDEPQLETDMPPSEQVPLGPETNTPPPANRVIP